MRHIVEIIKPGLDTVRIGPIGDADLDDWVGRLHDQLRITAHPQGTTIRHLSYQPGEQCLSPRLPGCPEGLADLIRAEPDGDGFGTNFPDLYTRLVAEHGFADAHRRWLEACAVIDHRTGPSPRLTGMEEIQPQGTRR